MGFAEWLAWAPSFLWHLSVETFRPRAGHLGVAFVLLFLPLTCINTRLVWINRVQLARGGRAALRAVKRWARKRGRRMLGELWDDAAQLPRQLLRGLLHRSVGASSGGKNERRTRRVLRMLLELPEALAEATLDAISSLASAVQSREELCRLLVDAGRDVFRFPALLARALGMTELLRLLRDTLLGMPEFRVIAEGLGLGEEAGEGKKGQASLEEEEDEGG
jgi:hypothetical protein